MDDPVFNLAEFIHESDLIERIDNDVIKIMRQINIRKRDGHVGAMLLLEELAQNIINQYVNHSLVCEIQSLIAKQHKKSTLKNEYMDEAGKYRDKPLITEERIYPQPYKILGLMEDFYRRVQDWQQRAKTNSFEQNVFEIAKFHFDFETICPFSFASGQTNRALSYYLLRFSCLRPFIFYDEEKYDFYYPCFRDPQNPRPLMQYFLKKATESQIV